MKAKHADETATVAVIGVDIGKEVFHLVGFGTDGKIAFRKKIRRLAFADTFEQLPPCIVGMEACLSAHFVSRTLRALGHEPRIIPAIYVKPFRGTEERLQRCRGNRRGGVATEPAHGPREEPGPARPAGLSSRPVPISLPEQRRSTRSEPFLSSRASPSGLMRVPFATRSSRYWRTERTRYRHERPS